MPYPVPPLGICLLAQTIKHKYQVKVYDSLFDEGKNLISLIRSFNPDYIGLTIRNIDNMIIDSTDYYITDIINLFIKPIRQNSSAKLIIGGSGFSIFPFELFALFNADYGFIGETDENLLLLLDCLENNKPIENIEGLITKSSERGKLKRRSNAGEIFNLHFSEIDKHIDFNPYKSRGVYSIQTKRGCRHKCIYCTYPLIEGGICKIRTPESIAEEIEQAYHRQGFITFEFVDSIFNDPPGHAEAICRALIKKNIKIRIRTMGINPQHCSTEMFKLMLKAGFTQIDCSPDSASPAMINNLKKNFTVQNLYNTARLIKEYNIPAMWFFIFGGPGETETTINESLDFIDKYISTDDMVHITTGLRIYPGTDLHCLSINDGIIKNNTNLLMPPVFYISKQLNKEKISHILKTIALTRPNCIPASESKPDPEMLKQALELRKLRKLDEPMFRTLLRIRKSRNKI
ncbi:MAG: radical SAM protein [Bacteroidia bacterium]|nr:radical SAM protein [Bacteroidia bacterium]